MITFLKNGFYVTSVTIEQYEQNKVFYNTLERTEISYDKSLGYVKPKLVSNTYIEGATAEEIEVFEDTKYPNTITALQFKLELVYSGIKNQVELVLDSLEDPEKTIAWLKYDKATEFDRKDQLIQSLGMAIGYTKTDINEFFLRASKR